MFLASTVWSRWNKISRAEKACHSARCGWSACQGSGTSRNSISTAAMRSGHTEEGESFRRAICRSSTCISLASNPSSAAADSRLRGMRTPLKVVVSWTTPMRIAAVCFLAARSAKTSISLRRARQAGRKRSATRLVCGFSCSSLRYSSKSGMRGKRRGWYISGLAQSPAPGHCTREW